MNLENSKLFRLLCCLEPNELNEFGRYIQNDFFNRKQPVRELYTQLKKKIRQPDYSLEKLRVCKKLFPELFSKGKPGNEKLLLGKLDGIIYHLKRHLQDFLVWKASREESRHRNGLLLKAYWDRDADRFWFDQVDKHILELEQGKGLAYDNHFRIYELMIEVYRHPRIDALTTRVPSIEGAMEHLDHYYLKTKLVQAHVQYGRYFTIGKQAPKVHLIDELLALARQAPYCDDPLIRTYAILSQAFRDHAFPMATYEELKRNCLALMPLGNSSQKSMLHKNLMNFVLAAQASIPANQAKPFAEEVANLYELAHKEGLLLVYGYISFSDFVNSVQSSAELGRFAWGKQFLESIVPHLKEDIRESSLQLGWAMWHYFQQDYAEALSYLNQKTKFSGLYDKLYARVYRIRCYYESGETDLLEHALEALTKFCQREKAFSQSAAERTRQFVSLTWQLVKYPNDGSRLREVQAKLESSKGISFNRWLTRMVADRLAKVT